ncbi:MAG TPA: hypothetical protein PKZ62_05460 [Thermoclostridium caenicola]|uniref:hypothetical protein n=1 Tax=Thermoclostridium caenicola TaxID=659425 RepID=UPI002C0A7B45|nr:hypothetical protein [Thermoclostridium caenicola]HOL84732.1 hypothetical protein [Thermoclostridium caenicola]HPO75867.1 hypothetical protein [Thermoclostridium caenicola]
MAKCRSLIFHIVTLFLCLALLLAGCARMQDVTETDEPADTPEATAKETPAPEITPTPVPNPDAGLTESMVSDYFYRNYPDMTLLDCFIEDFDRDGHEEALAVAGFGDEISGFYILRYRNGDLVQVGDMAGNDSGYAIEHVEPVRMNGSNKIYIHAALTNFVNLYGFSLYALDGDEIRLLVTSASPTGVGDDGLLDLEDDGVYEGYYQHRWSYDVYYYPVFSTYLWKDGEFVPDICRIELPDYPDSIEDTIHEYLILSILDLDHCREADDRLAMLFTGDPGKAPELHLDAIAGALFNDIMELDDGLNLKVSRKGNQATARMSVADTDGTGYAYTFHLVKMDYGWSIKSIE